VRREDLSFWDVGSRSWVLPKGNFEVAVGARPRDERPIGTVES
jgi:beta-glucosidase